MVSNVTNIESWCDSTTLWRLMVLECTDTQGSNEKLTMKVVIDAIKCITIDINGWLHGKMTYSGFIV